MSATLVLGIIIVWIALSAFVLVSVSMMSSRLSRMEEESMEAPIIELVAAGGRASSPGIPTQPRAEVLAER
jgi:hypothetical protein